ncbi:transcription termination/antitermination protein NusA [Campylobacter upsaliensis]|uniref:transcription termination factor NusA n=1 Tax=Campylobacter upsaliensis TaxID=28080 RepID=UPI0012BF1CD7|nr:transcription termination factor NusA [Campylobacter upsaliensis]ECK6872943.1 transcription termination/antitermination protein NusA [Campylobacter upsaliensis]ECK6874163.1 transcription termination/antitermination protein NusA [Campylobacter upsaliensis]ECV9711323.1 transcription termination/antitermination protein NusA [Campylobacter upsaliensis]ECV9712513.1 transcription termination/antitermination protein NusA [Campylobacter upsaliensis]MBT0754313.1 transcription termination/antitermina
MEKIADIIESIANEKNLELESVKDKVITALINTAKKIYGEEYEFFVDKKTLILYQKILIVADDDERLDENKESFIAISKAKKEAKDVEIGDELTYECSLENLGRTAVNTLHKELEYHIQKLLEQTIFDKYKNKVGQMVFGSVVRVDSEENTYIEIDELRAFLPRKNRIKGEKFKVGDVVKAVIRRVYTDKGIKMELSRTSPKFLECLLEAEVPEIKDGLVSVVKCARIPGERAKIILQANSSNIDPVGATVGVKGVRINAVSKEIHNENIDCIEYSSENEILIARALAPAIINSVKIEDKTAIVSLNSEQKSKAIGKNGINIRLTSMLSGFEIELKELGAKTISNEEAMKNLQDLFKI